MTSGNAVPSCPIVTSSIPSYPRRTYLLCTPQHANNRLLTVYQSIPRQESGQQEQQRFPAQPRLRLRPPLPLLLPPPAAPPSSEWWWADMPTVTQSTDEMQTCVCTYYVLCSMQTVGSGHARCCASSLAFDMIDDGFRTPCSSTVSQGRTVSSAKSWSSTRTFVVQGPCIVDCSLVACRLGGWWSFGLMYV